MVLGKLSVPGRPTYLDNSRIRAFCAYCMCELGFFGMFFGFFFSRLSFSLSLGDGSMETEILSQRAVKPKTTTQLMLPSIWTALVPLS